MKRVNTAIDASHCDCNGASSTAADTEFATKEHTVDKVRFIFKYRGMCPHQRIPNLKLEANAHASIGVTTGHYRGV